MSRQYKYLSEGQSLIMTDATTQIKSRYIVRSSQLCNDVELYAGGFSDAENTGWYNQTIWEQTITGRARIGMETTPVVAVELTALGFNGTESTDGGLTGDWINLES